ncbi:proto-oncogene tyrosine-protein kinase ROS-like [Anoplolepis gracilipes]|uniref:proto-oncogene tyrosine-protein kinase ROS-like n=1 Tax=Anoplolepis gracilipes TaxID=354296 RepID=UPI003BA3956E
MLKILCVLLKVLILTRLTIAISGNLENDLTPVISAFEINDHYMLSNVSSDSVTILNEADKFPSEPTFPRAFVDFGNRLNEKNISVTFRWKKPEFTNGVIQKYMIQYWFIENLKKIMHVANISATQHILQYKAYNLRPDTMYYFKVQAHNEAGAGSYTNFVNVSTTHENPVPLLFVVSVDNVLKVLDVDLQISFPLKKYIADEIVYLELERKIYWINNGELMTCDFDLNAMEVNNCTKITDVDHSANNLCLDWVARNLYWLEYWVSNYDGYYAMKLIKLDLALWQTGIKVKDNTYLQRNDAIDFLNVLPSTGKENALKYVQKVHIFNLNVNRIIAFSNSLQPYPPTRCLLPNLEDFQSKVINFVAKVRNTNSIVLNIPESVLIDGCKKYNLPTTIYIISVSYQTCLNNDLNEFDEFYVKTHERLYEIQNLTPFTTYTLKLALTNLYVDKLSMKLQFGEDVILRTTPGKLNAPENVTVQVLTPTLAVVYWMPPKNINCVAVTYEVHWMSHLFPNGTRKTITQKEYDIHLINQSERTTDGKFFMSSHQLVPRQEYLVYVRVYPVNFSHFFNDSLKESVYMHPEPNNLILSGSSRNSINISWDLNDNITHYTLKYKQNQMQIWEIANNTETDNYTVKYYIGNLLPETLYKFHLILKYCNYEKEFIWPPDGEFTFKTQAFLHFCPLVTNLSDKLNSIKETKIVTQTTCNVLETSEKHLRQKKLESLIVKYNYKMNNQTDINEDWNLYYNGTKNYYWITTKEMNQKYQFNVLAENVYGFRDWSNSSDVIDLTEIFATHYDLIIISTIAGLTIGVYCICHLYYSYRKWKENNNEQVSPSTMTNIELATLDEIPQTGNVQSNAMYASRLQFNRNELTLTIVEKKQISLTKLIGSGAFGKVYQATVKNLEEPGPMPVAIKTLRSNASSQQITEFLREAKFMSHFRHTHVLRLLSICIDGDSPWLILELMEADLLTYLRESRTFQPSNSQALRVQDLFAMCEDIARGCCYLEELHFVHRDLACRNCLISSRNRENRTVKIGDFGLARDIYKDHYYRKRGGGLLPVRWMAPESLVDGIFTSQSDVWAFGVLMWEIMSLGEQPYPAKSNDQVLEYVRSGGKLPKPLNCPPTLYELMQHCWNVANDRPNFVFCLNNIVSLRNSTEDATLSSVDVIRSGEIN